MFNLVGKRYLFLLISLAVILPGSISLLVKGLNVGIDFAGGATIELRPSMYVSPVTVNNQLKTLNLKDLQVLTGTNDNLPANQFIWVRLNTQVDQTVLDAIKNDLAKKYGNQLSLTPDNLTFNGKTVTVITVTNFLKGTTPNVSDVKQLLASLPNTTSIVRAGATPAAAPKATATVGKSTPAATATTGKGTPVASPTATTSNPAATIAVKYLDVQRGTTTQTLSVRTSSQVNPDELAKIKSAILNTHTLYTYVVTNATVSNSVASDTTSKAVLAVLAASAFILAYIWFSFRKVAKPWRYGACAIIALLHDVLVVLGVFSILGWLLGIQVDTLFITALLTVVGFSVHDTIVVFDRIRENMQRRTSETFEQVVNASLIQTMARSLNTSLTVLFTLSALTLFGGTTIRSFTAALLVGIFSGTYSSIFNASMLLVIWEKGELGLNRFNRNRTPDGREVRELARTR